MTGEVVDKIADLQRQATIVEVDGKTYSHYNLNPVQYIPRPRTISLHTLSGLRDYITHNRDTLDLDYLTIRVHSILCVGLWGPISEEDKQRTQYVDVEVDPDLEQFPFGDFMHQEAFQIRIRSMFLPTPDRELLIQYVSKLSIESSMNIDDDGITQTTAVKQGVSGALKTKEAAPSVVTLKPFRSFREVDQVESPFIFRMRAKEDGIPTVALIESDGGAWRNAQMQVIKDWLTEHIPDVVTIA